VDTLFLGVDGGNTKTIAMVAERNGRIVGAGRAGTGDIYGAAGPAAAISEITSAVERALASAGPARRTVGWAAFSLAGADWPEDFEFLREALASGPLLDARIEIVNDAIGALRAGTEDGIGVSVVCGTGDAIGARGPDGRIWHSSFWTRPSGGADELGRKAMRAILRAELSIGPPTTLTARALRHLDEPTVENLLHAFTRRERRRPFAELMGLAPVVLDEAEAGDRVAVSIVRRQGRRLAAYVRYAASAVGLRARPYPVVLAGGLFRHPSNVLAGELAHGIPDGRPHRAAFEPAVGALLLAFDAVGVSPDLATLAPTLPPPHLFAT
jgi:N-acetylglucosamine kinase-like BadF-type ATPase